MTDIDIPIWDDPDVQRIYDLQDGQPWPRFAEFNEWPEQSALVRRFIEADQNAGSNGPPSAFIDACLAGVHAVEKLPRSVDLGWIKFFVYFVDVNNHFLWDLHHAAEEVAAIAEWTVRTIHRNGWDRTAMPRPSDRGTATQCRWQRRQAVAYTSSPTARLHTAMVRRRDGPPSAEVLALPMMNNHGRNRYLLPGGRPVTGIGP